MDAVISLFEVDVAFVEWYFVFSGCSCDCAGHKECVHRTEAAGETELRVAEVVYFVNEIVEDMEECLFK